MLGLLCLATGVIGLMSGCAGGVLAPVESRDGYGPAPPGYYRILRGDTLMAVSRRTGRSVSTLAAWNNLRPPYQIYSGSLLRVAPPRGAGRRPTVAQITPGGSTTPASADRGSRSGSSAKSTTGPSTGSSKAAPATKVSSSGGSARAGGVTWQWPVQGKVEQTYRSGDRTRQGIRIATSAGAKIEAAAKGTVVYSGSGLKGYGNLIIVKHNDHFLSVYGFNRQLLAKQGDKVRAGQVIAEAGQIPNGKYLLHFEIRRDGATVDPLGYLPKR
ncbi:hypothetical protein CCR91_01145 [Thiorhodovibrio winogradskyi]|nr:hypothetical protein [Thiorhodovibrio winogradskyi]